MIAGFVELISESGSVIAIVASLLTIISGAITIYLFLESREKKKGSTQPEEEKVKKNTGKKSLFILVTIMFAVITISVLVNQSKADLEVLSSDTIQSTDTTEKTTPAQVTSSKIETKNATSEEIVKLVEEARRLDGKSTTEALVKFRQAYDLLTETQKRKSFVDSVEMGYMDFKTRFNYYNEFFKSLNF